jgi:plasmid maintenance system antidote protein VapI
MLMHDPLHPGELIRDVCLAPLGLTVTEAAAGLGVSKKNTVQLFKRAFLCDAGYGHPFAQSLWRKP